MIKIGSLLVLSVGDFFTSRKIQYRDGYFSAMYLDFFDVSMSEVYKADMIIFLDESKKFAYILKTRYRIKKEDELTIRW